MTAATASAGGRRLIRVDGPPLGHVPSFDGIRGIFIIQVVLHHAQVTTFIDGSPILIDWFFVASGFLITTLLMDEANRSGDVSLRRFYNRRARRLFPAMYAMLAVFTILMLIVSQIMPELNEEAPLWWLEPLGASFYVYNIVAAFIPTSAVFIGYMWSLAVEEQFYLFWPPVFRKVMRVGTRRTDLVLIGGAIAFVVALFTIRYTLGSVVSLDVDGAPVYSDVDSITWQGVVYRLAAFRPDMIVWGCLMALVARWIPRPIPDTLRKVLAVVAAFGWMWLVLVLFTCEPGPPGPFSLFGGPVYQFGLLLLGPIMLDGYFRQESWYSRLFSIRPARWLGQRAYGVYVWHGIVLLLCAQMILSVYGMQRRIIGTIVAGVAIGAGVLSYKYLELRFLKPKTKPESSDKVAAE